MNKEQNLIYTTKTSINRCLFLDKIILKREKIHKMHHFKKRKKV